MRQLFRAAHWDFARRQTGLDLLQDATGFTTNEQVKNNWPVTVGAGTVGMRPWTYEYRWPPDAVKVRFLPEPWNGNQGSPAPPGNYAIPAVPLWQGQQDVHLARQVPRRFLVANDLIPNLTGAPMAWNQIADTANNMGQGLTSQTVILANHKNATAVITALITYPDQWDPLFQEAFCAVLAERCALALVRDAKAAIAVRDRQIGIAKAALDSARLQNNNEGWNSTSHYPDWLAIRDSGSEWGRGGLGRGSGLGVTSYGHDAYQFSNSSAY
jgi:hypothetical protein